MNMDVLQSLRSGLRAALVCLFFITLALAATESAALFYLYSFDRDPKRWTNVNGFYARPREIVRQEMAPEPALLGALVVGGNNGTPAYARQYKLNLKDIKPSALHDCLLAAEDRRFYRHAGIDYLSASIAVFDHFVSGDRLRGASTISNQLIRTVILADQSRSFLRKIPELLITNVAERHFSKDDLLLSYVNNVPVGHVDGRALIGLSAASEALFGKKDINALSLSQSCAIAGMLNRPNRYLQDAIKDDYRLIEARRDRVLESLARAYPDRHPQKAIQQAKREEVRFLKIKERPASESRHLISYAYQQLPSKKPGLRIYLTIDKNLQRAAETSVSEELARFDRGEYGFYNLRSHIHAIKQGQKVTVEDAKLQAALVALDAKTGEILAMVGGRQSAGEFNRATQAKRAPGSLIKPFVYLYGIDSGSFAGQRFRADTMIDPTRNQIAQRYTTGGAASATVQLARSDNGAAIAIAHEFGISRVKDFIAKVTGANPVASELLAIGAGKGIELTPLQLASAYTVFTNNGGKVSPKSIAAVYDGERKIEIPEPRPVQMVNAAAALTVTRMLQSVIGDGPDGHYGTARRARELSSLDSTVALAGKTGTGDSDLWFVGFTPRIIVVVWVGFDNNYPSLEMAKGFAGSGLPLQIWARFMKGR
jgi:membrane peptidoglycan carboxypeptidase